MLNLCNSLAENGNHPKVLFVIWYLGGAFCFVSPTLGSVEEVDFVCTHQCKISEVKKITLYHQTASRRNKKKYRSWSLQPDYKAKLVMVEQIWAFRDCYVLSPGLGYWNWCTTETWPGNYATLNNQTTRELLVIEHSTSLVSCTPICLRLGIAIGLFKHKWK